MDDKELLKHAAAGCGINLSEWHSEDHGWLLADGTPWNPLADDGDALRLLAVMPSLWYLAFKFGGPTIEMNVAWSMGAGIIAAEWAGEGTDRATLIRRVIVRAAADVGMKKTPNVGRNRTAKSVAF